jgi:dTDP-4-dehydrorhamnose reductase
MDLLVVGGSGYLGSELVRQAIRAGRTVAATAYSRAVGDQGDDLGRGRSAGQGGDKGGDKGGERSVGGDVDWRRLDVRRGHDVRDLLRDLRPHAVVNAAYDYGDWATTAVAPAHLAGAAAEVGARLVHVSSDAVFSGDASPYDETRAPDPVSPYGAAKAAAEVAVSALLPSAVIARTSLIVGDGDSAQERMIHTIAAGGDGALFTDEVRCPIHVSDLAGALLELADSAYTGTAHVAGADAVSRYDLGLLVAARDGLDPARLSTGLRSETARRGGIDVRLDCRATQGRLVTRLRGVRSLWSDAPDDGGE